jgi:proteasome lid subunit RPN8/RPN11
MLHVGGIGFNYQADIGMRFLLQDTWKQWVSCIPSSLRGREGHELMHAPRTRHDAHADDSDCKDFLPKTENLVKRFDVVIDRSVLAAIVDMAFGDLDYEILGFLYGTLDNERREVRITDCTCTKRAIETLHPRSVSLSATQIQEGMDNKAGEEEHLVGWFHTHLVDQPIPSSADVEVHDSFFERVGPECVGFICSLDPGRVSEGIACNRVTFTAFRTRHAIPVRVNWKVRETPGFSPKAAKCCFDNIQNAEKENRELFKEVFQSTSSLVRKRWLHAKWEDYLIRIVQGTVPLIIQQVEQSSINLNVQRAQIAPSIAKHKTKGAVGSHRLCAADNEHHCICTHCINCHEATKNENQTNSLTEASGCKQGEHNRKSTSSRTSKVLGSSSAGSSGSGTNDHLFHTPKSTRGSNSCNGSEGNSQSGASYHTTERSSAASMRVGGGASLSGEGRDSKEGGEEDSRGESSSSSCDEKTPGGGPNGKSAQKKKAIIGGLVSKKQDQRRRRNERSETRGQKKPDQGRSASSSTGLAGSSDENTRKLRARQSMNYAEKALDEGPEDEQDEDDDFQKSKGKKRKATDGGGESEVLDLTGDRDSSQHSKKR